MSSPSAPPQVAVFRLPRSAYLVALLLVLCVLPLAVTRDGSEGSPAVVGPRLLLLLIPIAAAAFVARTATIVDATGVRVRAILGSRRLGWDELRGLSVVGRSVYAVAADGSVRLPCVRTTDLAALSRASGGRLPEIAEARPKFAPSRRRR